MQPAVGQGGVEVGEVEEGHLAGAEDERQPVSLRRAVEGRQAAGDEQAVEVGQPHFGEQADGGGVEGVDQGLPGGDPAAVGAVEVLRHVAGEVGGDVEEIGVGEQPAAVEGEGVEERLQGRARGAAGEGAVDLAAERRLAKPGRADHRAQHAIAAIGSGSAAIAASGRQVASNQTASGRQAAI